MEKIKIGKDKLTLIQCIELMRGIVHQYKVAGKDIYEKGYYSRGRTQNSTPTDGGGRGNKDVYYLDAEGTIHTLCYDTTAHRANVLLWALIQGTIHNVPEAVIDNYSTNGYSTKAGLFRSKINIDRIKAIGRSHADYLGNETGNSTQDHHNRVMMRK